MVDSTTSSVPTEDAPSTNTPDNVNSPSETQPETNGNHEETTNETELVPAEEDAEEDAEGQPPIEQMFQLAVRLPHHPFSIQVMVSTSEQMQDIRQSIIELPDTFQYSCFHLEHKSERINDFVELSDVPGITPDSELVLVEDPYTEKEARIHLLRVRELIGAAGARVDLVHGISAGFTLFDSVQTEPDSAVPNGDEAKHPMSNYDFNEPASFTHFLPKDMGPAPKTVKSISLSPWNPPPYNLRQRGHLMYLQITTLEGEQHHITSHVSGWYVSKSGNAKFDPFPRTSPKSTSAHSLVELLSKISPSFTKEFKALQEYGGRRDPLVTFQPTNAIPSSPWLVQAPTANAHQPDVARPQETFLISGTENNDTLRDFNEEFQSTRELPRESVQERVFRERLLSKLFADYTDAAVRGAALIARGEVAPLNPTEGRDAQIYVHNNIFFSHGADGVGTFAAEGGDEAARVATGKDVLGVRAVNNLDIAGLSTPGTVVVDYLGRRLVAQSIVPGIFKQRDPGENQIDYGGVEGRDIVATNETFVPIFEKLSKAMRVKSHPVWDKENKRHDLVASVETKGLLGTDGRRYVLDLYRTTPLDIDFIEKHWTDDTDEAGYPHRMAVLRSELVEQLWKVKMREYVNEKVEERQAKKKKEAAEAGGDVEEEPQTVDISGFQFALNPDCFAHQRPQTEEEIAEMKEDEQGVRDACTFLTAKIIPSLIEDLQQGDVGSPMDGQSLSRLMHKRGINMRYLGTVAKLAEEGGRKLFAITILAQQEMIARACKHHINSLIRYLPGPLVAYSVTHYLNCLLGTEFNPNPKPEKDEQLWELYHDADFGFEKLSPGDVRSTIEKEVKRRYRFDLPSGWEGQIKHIQMMRELALKLGLQFKVKEYQFVAKPDVVVAKSKKKVEVQLPVLTFAADDILNIVPVVKDAAPRSQLAEEALEAGRISILQGQKDLGQELLLESLSLHEQIYGILHPEVARVYNTLAMLYYQLEEKPAAVELARKAVIVSERTLGVDCAETILNYLNLGLFEHSNGSTRAALAYIRHAFNMWKIVYGEGHPDSVTTMNNVAVMLQALKLYHGSREWFEASLAVCEKIFGANSTNTATLSFQLAQALALDNDSKAAVTRMRDAYNVFLAELGPEDRNTKEAENWLEQLTQNAVTIAKQAKDMQNRRLRKINLTPRVTMQPVIDTVPAYDGSGPDTRSLEELMHYIDGTEAKRPSSSKKRPGRGNPRRRGGRTASD